jgi:hypothetical protein
VIDRVAIIGTGDELSDDTLRSRERWAAAVLLAIAAALLVLAAAVRHGLVRSAATGAVAALSFAGCATLGQGLWQATTALPALAAAVCVLAWRDRRPRRAIVVPALLAVAILARPTITPLALGVGLTWALPVRTLRPWLVAAGLALVVAAPFVVWNAIHVNSPLPLGQWQTNARATDHVFTLGGIARGIAGLVASPARGLVWFAPIVLAGTAWGLRDRKLRWIGAGIVLQLVVMSSFFKWHGGLAFGPRLMAEATWVAVWLAIAACDVPRVLLAIATGVTIVVGLIGLWRFDPDQWETRRLPERDARAYWDFIDSPIRSAVTPPDTMRDTFDAPRHGLRCEGGKLVSFD